MKNAKVALSSSPNLMELVGSVIDVIEVLTESPRARKYWNALKTKLSDEGSELSQELGQLKMQAEDGKMRQTDVADTEQLLRLIEKKKLK